MAMNSLRKWVCVVSAVSLLSLQAAQVQAAMVTTQELLGQTQLAAERSHMLSLLQQTEVQQQLQAYGVDTTAAAARVERMTASELAQLNHQIAELPAGGDALGVVALIFIILLITDIAGITDIFPFVRK